jgi:hypothetical protein
VLPALREISKELGLTGPFDIDMPVSLKAAADRQHTVEPA